MSNCFLRGSVIRYIHLSKLDVDEDLLLSISFEMEYGRFLHRYAARTEAEDLTK